MGEVKPWQLILIVAAFVALGVSAFLMLSNNDVQKASSMMLADIETGDLYEVKLKRVRGVTLPAKHPETGERTLVPVKKTDTEWVVPEMYRSSLDSVERSDVILDRGRGVLSVNEGSVRPFSR